MARVRGATLGVLALVLGGSVLIGGGTGLADASQALTVSARPAAPTPAPDRARPAPASAGAEAPDGPPVLHLTFDDGPDPAYTPRVLDLLRRHGATATFFLVGEEATRFPELVREVRAAGHAVGNHSWYHPWLTDLSDAAVAAEITKTDAAIGPTRCLRPPGGLIDDRVRRIVVAHGKEAVLWDVDTRDWAGTTVSAIVARVLAQAGPGASILLHDGGGPRQATVAALAELLPRLAAQGYRFEAMPACA